MTGISVEQVMRKIAPGMEEWTGDVIYTYRPCGHRWLVGQPSPLAMIPADGIVTLPSRPLPREVPTGTGWPAT